MNDAKKDRIICVGQFLGAHGVKGLVKLRSFTAEPKDLFTYAPLISEDRSRSFEVTFKSAAKDHYIVSVIGVAHKEDADQLRGDKLYTARASLPQTSAGQYYEADLIGLIVIGDDGITHGKVMDIHDHGAGTFLEIGLTKKDSFMLPFKDAFVPQVDEENGRIVIRVPEGWLHASDAPPKPDKGSA